jgi:hypothetical protein
VAPKSFGPFVIKWRHLIQTMNLKSRLAIHVNLTIHCITKEKKMKHLPGVEGADCCCENVFAGVSFSDNPLNIVVVAMSCFVLKFLTDGDKDEGGGGQNLPNFL